MRGENNIHQAESLPQTSKGNWSSDELLGSPLANVFVEVGSDKSNENGKLSFER
jgi:hypothetical protein